MFAASGGLSFSNQNPIKRNELNPTNSQKTYIIINESDNTIKSRRVIDQASFSDEGANFCESANQICLAHSAYGSCIENMTVEENIMFPLNMFSPDSTFAERLERVNFCLEKVNLPGSNNLYPSELSGGMQKRVGIARAIVNNPKYLFCDEPNSGLDPKTAIVIDNLIYDITKEFNTTTIINTHDMNSVMQIGKNIAFIHNGTIWWKGGKEDLTQSDNKELNDFVFASDLLKKIKSFS